MKLSDSYISRQAGVSQDGRPRLANLANDEYFGTIAQYMSDRHGMNEDRYSRQEIVDSYINHMRSFNSGQSVTTLGESAYLAKAEDAQRYSAGEAYRMWDNTQGAFEGGTTGEKLDAVYDYGRSLIFDPVNLLSLGVGKLVAGGASKAAARVAQEATTHAATRIATQAGERAATAGTQQAVRQAERRIIGNVIRGEAVEGVGSGAFNAAMSRVARREIIGTAAADTIAGFGIDAAYQAARIDAGVQNEYSWLEGGLSAAGGIFGGGLAYGVHLAGKGSRKAGYSPELAYAYFDRAETAKAAALKAQRAAARKSTSEALNREAETLTVSFRNSKEAASRWAEKVSVGMAMTDAADATLQTGTHRFLDAFLNGSKEGGFEGVMNILNKIGVSPATDDRDFKHFSDWLTTALTEDMPTAARKELEDLYEVTVGKNIPQFQGKSLEEGLNLLAATASETGQTLNVFAKAAKAVSKAFGDTPLEKVFNAAKNEIDEVPASLTVHDKAANWTSKVQQNLIRMIVTHPGTTALNVIGWVNASGMQSLSDMVRASLYSGTAIANLAVGRTGRASEYGRLATNLVKNQRNKVLRLLDPFATEQAVMDIMSYDPKTAQSFLRYMSGGIEDPALLRQFGLDKEKLSKVDHVIDFFQTAYGVKAVDMYTKTQEFMAAMEKQITLKYNMSYNDFIQSPDLYKKMDGDAWAEIMSNSVQDALRNTYSKSYGQNPKGTLAYVARMIEDARKYPVIGAMVPFGQFFNNTLATMFDYTGISLLHKYVAGTNRDAMELLTRSAVGLSLIGVTAQWEYANMEAGLAWHEERQPDGTVRSRLYDFPYSFYKAIGRVAAHIERDGGAPAEMIKEIAQTFGPEQLTRQLGESAQTAWNIVADILDPDVDVDTKKALTDIVGSAAGMYISGFTRPLDPANLVAGMAQGEDFVEPDRNQGTKWLNNGVRYVDQIFNAFDVSIQEVLGAEKPNEKVNPLRSGGTPVAIGRLFGYREVPAQNSIQTMFNEAGLAQWRHNLKANLPEANQRFNRVIFGVLEDQALRIIGTPAWEEASAKERVSIIRQVISDARSYTMDMLRNSYSPDDKRMSIMYELTKRGSGVTDQDINKLMADLELEGDLTDLSLEQLEFLQYYVELKKEQERNLKTNVARQR